MNKVRKSRKCIKIRLLVLVVLCRQMEKLVATVSNIRVQGSLDMKTVESGFESAYNRLIHFFVSVGSAHLHRSNCQVM